MNHCVVRVLASFLVWVAAEAQAQWQLLAPAAGDARVGIIEALRLLAPAPSAVDDAVDRLALRRVSPLLGVDVPVRVETGDSGEIVLVPRVPLAFDTRYAVVLKASAAQKGDSTTVLGEFTTVANPLVRQEYFRAGAITRYQTLHYDAALQLVRREEYRRTAGEADQLAAVLRAEKHPLGSREIYLTDPGPDGQWDTADDGVGSYARTDRDPSGKVLVSFTAQGAGTDGAWFTADDAVLGYFRYEYDREGRLSREIFYGGVGADGALLTADDTVAWYDAHQYTADSDADPSFRFDGPGRDGRWFTADDVVQAVAVTLAQGKARAHYESAGLDGIWLSPDDRLREYRLAIEEPGKLVFIQYDGPGRDGEWVNGDDAVHHYSVYESNEVGLRTRHVLFTSAGQDGIWLNEDDEPESYTIYRRDARGLPVSQIRYTGAGRDGHWFTADDRVGHYERYEVAANGSRVSAALLVAPGTDGLWFTPDDVPGQHSLYDSSR